MVQGASYHNSNVTRNERETNGEEIIFKTLEIFVKINFYLTVSLKSGARFPSASLGCKFRILSMMHFATFGSFLLHNLIPFAINTNRFAI